MSHQHLSVSAPFSVGIHHQALSFLAEILADRAPHNRLCLLLFDEMSIWQHYDYDEANDMILGYEDHGTFGRFNKPARYALVFMLRGLVQDWKLPIATFFTGSTTNAERLREILEMVLQECHQAGLQIISTVCDMDSSNFEAITMMGSTPDKPLINLAGQEYVTIFDPPHLLVSTRNLFQKYHVRLPVEVEGSSIAVPGIAKWSDIEQAFEWDGKHAKLRILRKLSTIHMQPEGRSKLRVDVAAQVLSQTVASFLLTGYSAGFLPKSAQATSRFVHQVDDMFDSLNGGVQMHRYHRWKAPVTRKSGHQEFWRSCRKLVDNWEFLEVSSSLPAIQRPSTVTGWLTTLAAVDLIWSKVKAIKVRKRSIYLKVRGLSTINLDPLENFFGCIRAQCGSERDPTISSFIDAWKTCYFSLAVESCLKGSNCQGDGGILLGNFLKLKDEEEQPGTSATSPES